MIISDVNDELIDEEILNKIKHDEETEQAVKQESSDNQHVASKEELKDEHQPEKDL